MKPMRTVRIAPLLLLTASLTACAAKAQVRTEVEVPLLEPPPPPPRVVAEYPPDPEPLPLPAPVEPPAPVRPPARPPRAEQKPEPAPAAPDPAENAARPAPPSLTLTPTPGSESQTVAAIRDLLGRATRDLSRVNTSSLNADGHAQYDTARRFIQQADEALKARNIVFAGKLADKAATMASVLAR
jgi:outer membrane biosynthesis protein TonB